VPSCRPETTAFTATAPVRASAVREVAGTPDEVFAVLADAEGWTRWFPGLRSCRWLSDAPHGVGSTRRIALGPLQVDEEFIVWEPGARFGFTFTSANLPGTRAGVELVELVPVDDGRRTRVSYTFCVEPVGVPRLVGARLTPLVRGALGGGLRGLDRELQRRR
jgi:carbon monoxide dehydrogenase subunit G